MYTNFLSSLTAVVFPHEFSSSIFLIFVALYQADGYAALPFVKQLLESYFPIYKQACYFVHVRFEYRVYFCGFGYVILFFRFTTLTPTPTQPFDPNHYHYNPFRPPPLFWEVCPMHSVLVIMHVFYGTWPFFQCCYCCLIYRLLSLIFFNFFWATLGLLGFIYLTLPLPGTK